MSPADAWQRTRSHPLPPVNHTDHTHTLTLPSVQAVNHRKNTCAWMCKWVPYSQRYLVLGLEGLVGLGLPLL